MLHPGKTASYKLATALAACLTRLTIYETESIARLVARESGGRRVEALICFGKALAAQAGTPSCPELSGEFKLIERTVDLGFGLAFDIGANVGDWTRHFVIIIRKPRCTASR